MNQITDYTIMLEKLLVEFKTENLERQKNENSNKKSIIIGLIGIFISLFSAFLFNTN